jgi:hypothetical protein
MRCNHIFEFVRQCTQDAYFIWDHVNVFISELKKLQSLDSIQKSALWTLPGLLSLLLSFSPSPLSLSYPCSLHPPHQAAWNSAFLYYHDNFTDSYRRDGMKVFVNVSKKNQTVVGVEVKS